MKNKDNASPRKNNKEDVSLKILNLMKWPIKVFIITLSIAFIFGWGSEKILRDANILLCLIIIIVFILIAIMFDIVAVSTTSCKIEPFLAMGSRHEKGAKQSIMLIRNAPKISTICADIVGDCCGILSGTVTAKFVMLIDVSTNTLIVAFVSAMVSAFTVSLKSISKIYSVNYCNQIVTFIGKVLYIFSFNKSGKKKRRK